MTLHHVDFSPTKIAEFCRRNHIRKFSLFGSIVREDFGPDSDVDVLVEFEPGQTPGFAFFGLQEELSDLLGRKVDLVDPILTAPHIRQAILEKGIVLHEP